MKWRSVRSLSAAVLLLPVLLVAGCDAEAPMTGGGAIPRRLSTAGELLVAAIGDWNEENRLAWQGLELAAREINQSGGILGKPLKLWNNNVPADPRLAIRQARDIARDPRTAMAILCSKRDVALPVSTILAYNGVLSFFTGESTPFHEVNLPLLFRLCPSDSDEMNSLTTFCLYKGIKRVGIFVSNSDFAKMHANTFETEARAKGMEIAGRVDCEITMSEGALRRELAILTKRQRLEAIFFSGPAALAVKLIKASAAQGLDQPFIGGSAWDTPELAEVADQRWTSVYLATPFAADLPGRTAQRFIQAYRQAYGEAPDAQAAINYNALHLYAQAARLTGSPDPAKVAATLYKNLKWDGPLGEARLNDLGELIFPTLYIKHFAKGRFKIIDFAYPLHWH